MLGAFLAYLAGILTVLIITVDVFFSVTSPSEKPPFSNFNERFLSWVVTTLVTLPGLLATAIGNALATLWINWRYIALGVGLLLGLTAWGGYHQEILTGYDAHETAVVYPFAKNTAIPIGNFGRIAYDVVVCPLNGVTMLFSITRAKALDITLVCDGVQWDIVAEKFGNAVAKLIVTIRDVILSGFTEDFQITPVLNDVADAMTPLEQLANCQCGVLGFVYTIWFDSGYGISQSANLHSLPDTGVALVRTTLETLFRSVKDIATYIVTDCANTTGLNADDAAEALRLCAIARHPKFEKSADLAARWFFHSGGFVDDMVQAVVGGLQYMGVTLPFVVPKMAAIPANGMAMLSDFFWITLDLAAHIDLVFTQTPSYILQYDIALPYSRLYNVTSLIEEAGDDLGTDVSRNVAIILARPVNIVFRITELYQEIYILAFGHRFDMPKVYAGLKTSDIPDLLETDANIFAAAIVDLGADIGYGTQYILSGFTKALTVIIQIVRSLMTNIDSGFLDYLKGAEFRGHLTRLYRALKEIAGGFGSLFRSWGAWGTVDCTPRNVTYNVDDLSEISLNSMDLNIMCFAGTTLEMAGRWLLSFGETTSDTVFFLIDAATSGSVSVSDFTDLLAAGAPGDLTREDGLTEHTCMILDCLAMGVPSTLNMIPWGTVLQCSHNSYRSFLDVAFSILRTLIRLPLIVFNIINQFGRLISAIVGGATIDEICDILVVGMWRVTVAPAAEAILAPLELLRCGGVNGALGDVMQAIGRMVIDENYIGGDVTPCDSTSSTTATIPKLLCGFVEQMGSFLNFIIDAFEIGPIKAIWNWLSRPLLAILGQIADIFVCILNLIGAFFSKIGSCFLSLFRMPITEFWNPDQWRSYVKRIERACGNWGSVFTPCDFSITLKELTIDDVLVPGGGTVSGGGTPIAFNEHFGACFFTGRNFFTLEVETMCFGPGAVRTTSTTDSKVHNVPQRGEDCVTNANHPGVQWHDISRFYPGVYCTESEPPHEVGCCCNPKVAKLDTDFETCNLTNQQTQVFIPNHLCDYVNSDTCNVFGIPNSNIVGCCAIQFNAVIGTTEVTDVRTLTPMMSGRECAAVVPVDQYLRSYFIPGDETCDVTRSYNVLDNVTLSDILTLAEYVGKDSVTVYGDQFELDAACCTPRNVFPYGVSSTNDLYGGLMSGDPWSDACWASYGFDLTYGEKLTAFGTSIANNAWLGPDRFGTYAFKRNFWNMPVITERVVKEDVQWNCWDGSLTAGWFAMNNADFNQEVPLGKYGALRSCDPTWSTYYWGTVACPRNLYDQRFGKEGTCVEDVNDCPGVCASHGQDELCGSTIDIYNLIKLHPEVNPFPYGNVFTVDAMLDSYRIQCRTIDDSGAITGLWTDVVKGAPPPSVPDRLDCRWRGREGLPAPEIEQCSPSFSVLDNYISGTTIRTFQDFARFVYLPQFGMNATRDNTDRNCGIYSPPPYTAGPTVTTGGSPMLPAGFALGGGSGSRPMTQDEAKAVMSGKAIVKDGEVYLRHSRRLMAGGTTGYIPTTGMTNLTVVDKPPFDMMITDPTHPCHMFTEYDATSKRGMWREARELQTCLVSTSIAFPINMLLGGDDLYVDPLAFMDLGGFFPVASEFFSGFKSGFGFAALVLQYHAANKTIPIRRWVDFAPTVNVTSKLSVKVGQFIAWGTNLTIRRMRTGGPMPVVLYPFQFFVGLYKYVYIPYNTTAIDSNTTRESSGTILSPYVWDYLTGFFNMTMETTAETFAMYGHPMAHAISACDPRDRTCTNCSLLSDVMDKFVEVILACTEDLQDPRRFSLNFSAADINYTNTFWQPGDPDTCQNATLNFKGDPTGVAEYIVDLLGVRRILAKAVCFLTNYDAHDPQSPSFWAEKFWSCDPITSVSGAKGRAGLRLKKAIIYVTLGLIAAQFVVSQTFPLFPATSLWVLWPFMVASSAYFMAPTCFIPGLTGLGVFPATLADDLYVMVQGQFAGDCRDYGDILDGQACSALGRQFPDCSAAPYSFDVTGIRAMHYVLDTIPGLTDLIFDIDSPVVDWLRDLINVDSMTAMRGTPKGTFCFWAFSPTLGISAGMLVIGGALALMLAAFAVAAILSVAALISLSVMAVGKVVLWITGMTGPRRRIYRG